MKAPAFQCYAADFYMDTIGWSATEVGVYFRLLLHEWVNGPLPDSIPQLSRIAGVDVKTMGKFWVCTVGTKFVKKEVSDRENSRIENGKNKKVVWENSRLESTRETQRKYSESQKEKVEKRWSKNHTTVLPENNQNDTLQSSSSLKKVLSIDNMQSRQPDCPHKKIIALYNKNLEKTACPYVDPKTWKGTPAINLTARWKEDPERQNLEWWDEFFWQVSVSEFLTGKKKSWRADLQWIVQYKNFTKILQMNYHMEPNELSILARGRNAIMGENHQA
jgi:uncharacterized protein YdaU (DUF1376 family)